jgi:hypothetical protein
VLPDPAIIRGGARHIAVHSHETVAAASIVYELPDTVRSWLLALAEPPHARKGVGSLEGRTLGSFVMDINWVVVVEFAAGIVTIATGAIALPQYFRSRSVHRSQISGGSSLVAPTAAAPIHVRGHADLLAELRRWMRRPPGRIQVLTGLGGVGKSTIAVELYRWVKQRKHSAWWVTASDSATLTERLVSLARVLGADNADVGAIQSGFGAARDRVWELLDRTRRDWLLVFDNADDPGLLGPMDGTGWLRRTDRGLILVTSRCRLSRLWGNEAAVHEVGVLSQQDAAQLLIDRAPQAGNRSDAEALASRLGCLPLALHLVGTYLSSQFVTWHSFADYKHALDTMGVAGLVTADETVGSSEDSRSTVMRTWELSLDSLARHGLPQATPLLRLLSCYATATPIPLALLHTPAIGDLVVSDDLVDEAVRKRWVDEGLRGLHQLSLVTAHQPATQEIERGVVIHPLVAETNRIHLDHAEDATASPSESSSPARIRRTAVKLIGAAVEPLRYDDRPHWSIFRALDPHVSALLETTAPHLDGETWGCC